jgi:hypothetical protein
LPDPGSSAAAHVRFYVRIIVPIRAKNEAHSGLDCLRDAVVVLKNSIRHKAVAKPDRRQNWIGRQFLEP